MWSVRVSGGAGNQLPSPSCVAVIEHAPAPVMCTNVGENGELRAHAPSAARATGSPDVATASTPKSGSPNVWSPSVPKEIVCAARLIVKLCETSPAGEQLSAAGWKAVIVHEPPPTNATEF